MDWTLSIGQLTPGVAIGSDNTVFFGADNRLLAYRPDGVKRWEQDLVEHIWHAPAIGQDGTIYVGANAGLLAARYYTGGMKWHLTTTGGAALRTPVILGANGTLYVGDAAGRVFGVKDNGSSASILWTATLPARPTLTALSHDGKTLYVGTVGGKVHALSTANGAQLWEYLAGGGSNGVTVLAIRGDGNILTGTDDGIVRLLTPSGGLSRTRSLGGKIRAAAYGPAGWLYVISAYGSYPNYYNQLFALNYSLEPNAAFNAWNDLPDTASSLLVDATGMIWGTFELGKLVGIEADGQAAQSITIPTYFNLSGLAMNNDGALLAANGSSLTQTEPGWQLENQTRVYEPRVVPYFGTNVSQSTRVRECNTTLPLSYARPGMTYETDADGKFKTVGLTTGDTGCPISWCNDQEGVLPPADVALLLSSSRNPNNPSDDVPLLPASYSDRNCNGTSYPQGCDAIDPNGVDYGNPCSSDAECGSGKVCATVCPETSSGQPASSCHPDLYEQVCATIDKARCSTLPSMTTGCHEVRECLEDEHRLTQSEATPKCFAPQDGIRTTVTGGASCDVEKEMVAATPEFDPVAYPGVGSLWATDTDTCSLRQYERGASSQSGGNGANAGRGSSKKWGLWASADAKMGFETKPLPFGFVEPSGTANANFDVLGKVWGKEIVVLDVNAQANINKCNINGTLRTKLFGQDIDTLSGTIGSRTGDGACNNFYTTLENGSGDVRNMLTAAARAYAYVKDAASEGRQAVVTEGMCRFAFAPVGSSLLPTECQAPYTAAKAAAVVNRIISKYNAAITAMLPGGSRYNTASSYLAQYVTNSTGFSTENPDTGALSDSVKLVDVGSPFSIIGAQASFPIGPFIVDLEVAGVGEWGLSGTMTYGATFLPPAGVNASIIANPYAAVDVDLFMGVGFGLPGLKATVGVGGLLTLVEMNAPLRGTAGLQVSSAVASQYPNRSYPSAFARFQGTTPRLAPRQFNVKGTGSLQAATVLEALSGELDGRLRLQFLWFNKTFKKRITKLEGKTWPYDWMGTMDLVESMPALTFPVLDPIPFPTIPAVSSSDFTWLNNGVWPTSAGFSAGSTAQTKAQAIEKMPKTCDLIIL